MLIHANLIKLSKFLNRIHIPIIRNPTLQGPISFHLESRDTSPTPISARISWIVTGFAHQTFKTFFLCPVLIGADIGEICGVKTSTGGVLRMRKCNANAVNAPIPI